MLSVFRQQQAKQALEDLAFIGIPLFPSAARLKFKVIINIASLASSVACRTQLSSNVSNSVDAPQ